MAKDNDTYIYDLPVKFGQVSLGKAIGRIGVKVDRTHIPLEDFDEILCGKRVIGSVVLGRKDDSPGQKELIEGSNISVAAAFDVLRFGVSTEEISASLSFNLGSVNLEDVAHLSTGEGRFLIERSEEIPEDVKEALSDEQETPDTLTAEGPWREVPLSQIFSGSLLKSLAEGKLKTVGDLCNYTASDDRLTDLPGIGENKAAQIEETMLRFWEVNEITEDEAVVA